MPTSKVTSKAVGIDHTSIRVGDFKKSKEFYGKPRHCIAAAEYHGDYYAVLFLDPNRIKLEGMKYGELTAKNRKQRTRPGFDASAIRE